jgi:3-oxoacyl-[acyl-carrier-protein] synthase-3
MFITRVSHYYPEKIVPNSYFEPLNGLSNEWIVERTGMKERRKAAENENTNTMAVEAVKRLQENMGDSLSDVDLIVGGTYSPYDTVVTLAHQVQHYLQVPEIPVVSLSSACSTLLNAIEIVEGYFALGKASKAIVVVSEHNTAYQNVTDPKAGHLWGDGSSAMLLEKEQKNGALKIKEITTGGAATVGQGTNGVSLKPLNGGINMPAGKDVFINACNYMAKTTKDILEKNGYSISDLNHLIPHQANLRITKNVAQNLGLKENIAVSNVSYLGNTGCAGCAIGLSERWEQINKGDVVVLTVFGGGYSYGAMLIEA